MGVRAGVMPLSAVLAWPIDFLDPDDELPNVAGTKIGAFWRP
jgi:hypothetical protein